MQFERFSRRQMAALGWWAGRSPYRGLDAIICDGAVRSGKTICLMIGFLLWAMGNFSGERFALCARSVGAVRRNLLDPIRELLPELGISCVDRTAQGYVSLRCGTLENRFYLFGGRDARSAAAIQGITLAGVLFDEVALMPRSFVEQGCARCSVGGAKLWFSCNPEHPAHWFYREWILHVKEKKALYLHFTMDDNPGLSPAVRKRYERMYSGSFYERFVLGRWTAVQGAVYPMFSEKSHVVKAVPACRRYYIACDYGTVNPASFGLWGEGEDGIWYRVEEYYHDGRSTGVIHTDEEYHAALVRLAGERKIEGVVVDPSAASFLACIRRHGTFLAIPAENEVAEGIRTVSGLLRDGRLKFAEGCRDCIREFSLYQWEENAGRDLPRKQDDHAMDEMRYFVMTVLQEKACPFYAASVGRNAEKGGSYGVFGAF